MTVLGAALQAPISAVVLVLELTHAGQNLLVPLVPLVLAVTAASLTARLFEDRSTYTVGLPETAVAALTYLPPSDAAHLGTDLVHVVAIDCPAPRPPHDRLRGKSVSRAGTSVPRLQDQGSLPPW